MESHVITQVHSLSKELLLQIAYSLDTDEISNIPGSVRHHIYWHGERDKKTNKLRRPMLFFIYQTTRHGPQNGFRLCLVYSDYYIPSPEKAEGEWEDEIDRLEKDISQGHQEVVFLGEPPVVVADDDVTMLHPWDEHRHLTASS